MGIMANQICIRALADVDQINACKNNIESNQKSIAQLANVLGLAGNEVRLKMLYLFSREKELCVCDLSDILKMNVSAISQHLRKLKDGNIVDIRKDGQTYYYFLKQDHQPILDSILGSIPSKNKTLEMS